MTWEGKAEDEVGYEAETGRKIIVINKDYYRPAEVDLLLGDYSKAKKELGGNQKPH